MKAKKLRLYDAYTTYYTLFGMLFFNVLCFGLGVFFVKIFIIEDYDPAVFLLLLMLPGGVLALDFICIKEGLYSRLLLRCRITDEGIVCSGIGWKRFTLAWDDVKVYGVAGYSWPGQLWAFMFFSINTFYNRQIIF